MINTVLCRPTHRIRALTSHGLLSSAAHKPTELPHPKLWIKTGILNSELSSVGLGAETRAIGCVIGRPCCDWLIRLTARGSAVKAATLFLISFSLPRRGIRDTLPKRASRGAERVVARDFSHSAGHTRPPF